MKAHWWRPLVVVAALFALLTVLLIRSRSPDLVLRERMHEALQNYRLFDAELTRDVLKARAGLLPNYDPLARDRRNLKDTVRDLKSEGEAGSSRARELLAPYVENVIQAQDRKLAWVERFKSRNALLQNSLRFVTSTAPVLQFPAARGSFAADVGRLPNSVLHFMQVPDAGDALQIRGLLDRLALSRGSGADLDTLVAHGRLILTLVPEIGELLRQITAAPAVDPVSELQAAVRDYDQAVEKAAQSGRVELYGVSVLLVAYIVFQFARLRRAIVERLRAAAALRASEGRLQAISESAKEAIVSVGADSKIVSWNAGAAAMFGYPAGQWPGQDFSNLWPPPHRKDRASALADFFKSGDARQGSATQELTGLRKDGSEFPLEVSLSTWSTDQGRFLTAIMRDISERRRLQEDLRQKELQLIQKNRMAVLGLLVSGVAHDINNPNSAILSDSRVLARACEELLDHVDSQAPWPDDATLAGLPYGEMRQQLPLLSRDIHEAATRIHHIVDDLRDFYRSRPHGAPEPFDLNDVVRRSVRLFKHKIDDSTRHFRTDLAPSLPPALGDAQQFGQVVSNLLVNALEALPDPGRGVTMSTSHEVSRQRVVLVVQDQGVGISELDLRRIGDPFFTTKQSRGGSGLGLATTTMLLRDVGGHLRFESEPGRGTRAIVDLGCVG